MARPNILNVRVVCVPGGTTEVNVLEGQNSITNVIEGVKAIVSPDFNVDGKSAQIDSGDPIEDDNWEETMVPGGSTVYFIENVAGGRS